MQISSQRPSSSQTTQRAAQPQTTTTSRGEEYVVKPGDTLSGISTKTQVSKKTLLENNPQIKDEDKIYAGQKLLVKPAATHTVKKGDTLSEIADAFDVDVNALVRANKNTLQDRNLIFPGQKLQIPGAQPQQPQAPVRPPQPQRPQQPQQSQQPAQPPRPQQPATPGRTQSTGNTAQTSAINNGFKNIDLKDFLSTKKGTQSLAAIVIGNAEGTRTPDGGMTPAFGGHKDPGNKANNKGSFSYQASPVKSTAEADLKQLQAMNVMAADYTKAAKQAGLDPNNALLAATYFDSYNQSPSAAARFLKQLPTLKEQGVTAKSLIEARYHSYVDPKTGSRYLNGNGSPVGSGLANIARDRLRLPEGARPPESEVLKTIRDDQARRVNDMVDALQAQGLTDKPGRPAAPAARPQTPPAKPTAPKPTAPKPTTPTTQAPPSKPTSKTGPYTSLAAAKASGMYVDQRTGDPSGGNANCGFTSSLMALKALGITPPTPDKSIQGNSESYRQAMMLRKLGDAGTKDGSFSKPWQVKQALNSVKGAEATFFGYNADKAKTVEAMRQAFLNPKAQEIFVAAGNPTMGWKNQTTYDDGHWVAVTGYDANTDRFIVMDPFVPAKAPIEVTAKELAGYLRADNAEGSEVIQVTRR